MMRKHNTISSILSVRIIKQIRVTSMRARLAALFAFVAVMTLAICTTSSASSVAKLFMSATKPVAAAASHLSFSPPSLSVPQQGSVDAVLNVERRGHTATQLADGRVLIVGGENGNGPVSQAEIYDPSSRSLSIASASLIARTKHAAVRLADGRILITGGKTGADRLDSTEIFDPASGYFSGGPNLNRARSSHTATLLADGRVLIAGGDPEATSEIFNPQTQSFTLLEEPMTFARTQHSAVLLPSGEVLLIGGADFEGNKIQSGELFYPEYNNFALTAGTMNTPRLRPILRLLPDNKVQIIGGNDEETMEVFDSVSEEFGAYAHVAGSAPQEDIFSTPTRAALFHKAQSGSAADPLLDRTAYTVTELQGLNQALVVGGTNSTGQILNTASVFNSSPATVTTDLLEVAPGVNLTISGSGWQAGETVSIVLHRDPPTYGETTLTAIADANGNFTNRDFTPQQTDSEVTFVVTAKGQASAFVAQTSFHDAIITNRLIVNPISRLYGQTTPDLRAQLCSSFDTTTGVCTPFVGQTLTFALGGVDLGTAITNATGVAVYSFTEVKNAGPAYNYTAKFSTLAPVGATLVVNKVTPTVTWTPTPIAIVYGTALGSTHQNAVAKDNTVNSVFTGQAVAGAFAYTPVAGTVLAAGASQSLSTLFTPSLLVNYFTRTAFNTANVSKAPLSINVDSFTRTFGEANPTFTGTITGLRDVDGITVTYSTTATPASPAGTYDITATVADPLNKLKNYTLTNTKGTLTINKAKLTLTAENKTRAYGIDNPPFTINYSGFVNGDTEATAVITGAPSLTTPATVRSASGIYPINITAGTLASPNYDFIFVDGTLTVTKAASTLTLSSLTQTYNGTPKPVVVVTDPLDLEGVTVTYNGSPTAPTNAGTYAITAELNNPNYDFANATGTLTINKADQTINFAPIGNKTYGDAPVALSVSSTIGLPVSLQVVSGNVTLSGTTLSITGAGPVVVRASQSGNENINAATDVVQTFDVARAQLAINIDQASLTQTYNGATITANVTTTPAGVEGLTVSYSQGGIPVPAPTNAGKYNLTATFSNANYVDASAFATLIITQATVQLTFQDATHIFDGRIHPATPSLLGYTDETAGKLMFTYTPQTDIGPEAIEPALPPTPADQIPRVPAAPAFTEMHDPPVAPHSIIAFPSRDFVSAAGYSQSDGVVTVNVLRKDATGTLVTVGSSRVTPQDDPTTPEFDGIVEVNHPGAGCWEVFTPNIRGGDIVRITNAAGVADQTTVAFVSAGLPVQFSATTVVISGFAMDAAGKPLPLADIEQRMISSSADPFILSGRRDLRAPGNGVLIYDDPEEPTHWTATYTGLQQADIDRIMRSETRILWLGRDNAAGTELTIFEAGDGVAGGPQTICSGPPEGTDPFAQPIPVPVPPAPAYTALNDPPVLPRSIIAFPERDFVSAAGYTAADGPVTVSVLRSVTMRNGTTSVRTVGSSVVTPQDDPTTPLFDGIVEVNHPGGGCWDVATPDIRPGDIVRITTAAGVADQIRVANVTAERPVQMTFNTVVIHGTAQDAAGRPLPITELEQRMISSSKDRFNVSGRRDLRAAFAGEFGILTYDEPGSIHWTATYKNLGASDVLRVLRSETRILWLGRNAAAGVELTIFEVGEGIFPGPSAPCTAPIEGSTLPVWVGTYDVSVSLTGNPNFKIAANQALITITKATPTVDITGGPFTYDRNSHAASVVVTGVGGNPFVPPSANTATTYSFGAATTANAPVQAGAYNVASSFSGSKNYNPASGVGQVVINKATPVVAWAKPADINFGTSLGNAQLNANASLNDVSVDGTFTYTPAASTLLNKGADQTLSAIFAPADTRNFNEATASVLLTVINHAPVAEAQTVTVDEDTARTITLTSTDVDGNSLTFAIVNQPVHGSLGQLSQPSCTVTDGKSTCTVTAEYTPAADYNGADSLTFKTSDTQDDSNVGVTSLTINPVNDVPVTNAGSDGAINEANTFAGGGSFSDPDPDSWTATVNYGDGSATQQLALSAGKSFSLNHHYDDSGVYTLTVVVRDSAGATGTDTAIVTVNNVAPTTAITGAPAGGPEGTQISVGNTTTDPSNADTAAGFQYAWSVTRNGSSYVSGSGAAFSFTPNDNGSYVVTVRATDKDGGIGTDSKTIVVTNVAPTVGNTGWTTATGTAFDPMTAVKVGTAITASANFSDAGTGDTQTAVWDWNANGFNGSASQTSAGTVTAGTVRDSHIYTAAGIYTVKLSVTDDDTGTAQTIYKYVVVYDPAAGGMNGNGSVNSPAGSYTANASLAGTFTISQLYAKYGTDGTLTSAMNGFRFTYSPGSLIFTSSKMNWMVSANGKLWVKGEGTTSMGVACHYLISVVDSGSTAVDRMRVKVYRKDNGQVIYDTQKNADGTSAPDDALATPTTTSSANITRLN